MTNMTPERLAEIEERCNAATSGLWESDTGGDVYSNNTASQGYKNHTICERPHDPLHPCESELSQQFINMEFIAHARQDIPDLLAEVHRLKGELAKMEKERDVLARVHADCGVCPLCGKLTVEQYDPNTDLWLGVSCTSCSWSIKYARPLTTSMYYAQQHAEKQGGQE